METVRVLVDEPLYTIVTEDDDFVISILTSGAPGNLTQDQARLTSDLVNILSDASYTYVTRRQHSVDLRWEFSAELLDKFFEGKEGCTHRELLDAARELADHLLRGDWAEELGV